MDDCAHFHYEAVELEELKVSLATKIIDKDKEKEKANRHESSLKAKTNFSIIVSCRGKWWTLAKTYVDLRAFDQVLHKCVYDRKYSKLRTIVDDGEKLSKSQIHLTVSEYFQRFTQAANHRTITCSDILRWLELDNHGNQWVVGGNAPINIQAVAAAQTVKAYVKQVPDELSLAVGDLLSIINMEGTWWRGKKGFEVGFFPSDCVELIKTGDQSSLAKIKAIKPIMEKKGKAASALKAQLDARPSRLALKRAGIVKERLFGCDLAEHLQNVGRVGELPVILKSCVEFIESRGPVEGLYRLSGSTSRVQKLRNEFDANKSPDLSLPEYQLDTHSLCSLLKIYFRELPNPLFTFALYDKFIEAANNSIAEVAELLCQLPPAHSMCASFLIRHLAKIADAHEQTRMDCKNLAIVWAPNLLRPRDADVKTPDATILSMRQQAIAVEFLIHNAAILFEQTPASSNNTTPVPISSNTRQLPPTPTEHKKAPPLVPLKDDSKSPVAGVKSPIVDDAKNRNLSTKISPPSPASPPTFTVDDLPPPPAELLLPAKSEQPSKPDVPHTKPPVPLHKTAGSVPALHRPPPSVPSDDGSRSFSPQASKDALLMPKSAQSGGKSPVGSPRVQNPVLEDYEQNGKYQAEHKQTFGKAMSELEQRAKAPPPQPPKRTYASLPRSNAGPPKFFDEGEMESSDVWVPRTDVKSPPKDTKNSLPQPSDSTYASVNTKKPPPSVPVRTAASGGELIKPMRLSSWPGQMDAKIQMQTDYNYDEEASELDVMVEASDA